MDMDDHSRDGGRSPSPMTKWIEAQKRKPEQQPPRTIDPGAVELEAGLQFLRSALQSVSHEARLARTTADSPGLTRITGILEDMAKTLGNLISKKGKLRLSTPPLSPAAKKLKPPELSSPAEKPTMKDACTDTELTPSWWDSDAVFEAESRRKKRRARSPQETGRSKVFAKPQTSVLTRDTEVESAMDTDAEVPWSSAVSKGRKRRKAIIDTRPSTANEPPIKPPAPRQPPPRKIAQRPAAVLVKVSEGNTYADTLRAVRSTAIDFEAMGTHVTAIRKTIKGDLLVELTKGA